LFRQPFWGNPMKKLFLSVVFFAIGGLLFGQPAPAPVSGVTFPPLKGKVLILPIRAIDGDTFDAYHLVRIRTFRIKGINAPEVEGLTKEAGLASKANLDKLLPRVPTPWDADGYEKYGRHLGTLYQPDDVTIVGKQQVDQGFAKDWDGKGPRP
jgi:hypothetical protein